MDIHKLSIENIHDDLRENTGLQKIAKSRSKAFYTEPHGTWAFTEANICSLVLVDHLLSFRLKRVA